MAKVDPVKALISGKITKDDIGKTVYLSNSTIQCQEWLIADINHDDTEGTVDLFPKYALEKSENKLFGGSYNGIDRGASGEYYKSYMREYAVSTIYNGFSTEIKNMISSQYITSNGSVLFDKVKIPSVGELGFAYSDGTRYWVDEGSVYPIFGEKKQSSNNSLAIYKNSSNKAQNYWTRTLYVDNNISYAWKGVCLISTSGYPSSSTTTSNQTYCNTVACIRFARKDPAILEELSKPNPIDILTSGKITKDYIGFPVTITNTAIDCQEWIIADVNHDNTEGTVDLFPRYVLSNSDIAFNSNRNGAYANSALRTWLCNDVYNGFANEVKNALEIQNFPSNGVTLSDKIKCPSMTEIGSIYTNSNYYAKTEGTVYPVFGNVYLMVNTLAIRKRKGNNTNVSYWSRSMNSSDSGSAWLVNGDGTISGASAISNIRCYSVAIIRFGKK